MNNDRQIKVYTEKDHAEEKDWLRHLVHPIRAHWGDGTPEWRQWEKDFYFYKILFLLTDSIDESDVVFLPMTFNYYVKNNKLDLLNDLVNRAKDCNKTTFIWVDGDHQPKNDISGCVFLKYSSFKSRLRKNEIILPGDLKQDLLVKYCNGKPKLLKKGKSPRVGFVGYGDIDVIKLIYQVLRNSLRKISTPIFDSAFENEPMLPFVIKRKKILNKISSFHGIKTDFIRRTSYAAGIKNNNEQNRLEFITNIVENDYTVCMRGGGNYSIRLYETLCLCRVPIFINTDCKLPFEEQINWKEICVWIEEKDLIKINDKIIDHHNSLTEKQFIERQHFCREIWLKYLSKEGFYNHFHSYLDQHLLQKEFRKVP